MAVNFEVTGPRIMRAVAVLAIISASATAHAQAAGVPDAPVEQAVPPTSDEAPVVLQPIAVQPTEVSGLIEARDEEESVARRTGRVLLLPLRGLWFVVMAPVRLSMWALERFAVRARFRQFFFSEDGKLGLYPIVNYKSGFGPGIGGRFIMRDLLGNGSRLRVSATYGGEVMQSYSLRYRSGMFTDRRIIIDAAGGFHTYPRNRFFGIGNRDLSTPGPMPVDPWTAAFDTRYFYDQWAAETSISGRIGGPIRARLTGSYRWRTIDTAEVSDGDLNTFDAYDVDQLTGARDGTTSANGDLTLIFDTLRQPRSFNSRAMPSRGWYAELHGGVRHGVGVEPSDYVSWGLDLQRYFNLYADNRILLLRAVVEGVSGSFDDVPFMDLPKLGGGTLLRGFPQDRFRDRRSGVATVEYQWNLSNDYAGFLFTDIGRVWRNLDDLEQGEVRIGFGGGLQTHTMKSFVGRAMIASTNDGGVFFLFGFDPLFEQERER